MSMSSSIALARLRSPTAQRMYEQGFTQKTKKKQTRSKQKKQTRKPKTKNKEKQRNKKTWKNPGFDLFLFFFFLWWFFQSVCFFVVNLFLIMWLMFFLLVVIFLLQSTFSVPVGLKMLNNKFIDSSYSPYAPWKTCQSCMFRECQSCFPRFYTKYHYTATLILMILVCIFCC